MKRTIAAILAVGVVATSCAVPGAKPQAATQPVTTTATATAPTSRPFPILASDPKDPLDTSQRFFELRLFSLALPLGMVSTNEEFWQAFDESFLGFRKQQILFKSGFRVGKAPFRELVALTEQLADAEQGDNIMYGAGGQRDLPWIADRPEQTLFYMDEATGIMVGKTLPRADELFAIEFRQLARQPDHVWIAISPKFSERRQALQLEPGRDVRFYRPETIYKLGIGCELGADECLVIAPSIHGVIVPSLMGSAFMVEERPAQRVERVLVVTLAQRKVTEQKPTPLP